MAAVIPSWSDECPICKDTMTDRVFIHPCNHDFDRACINDWKSEGANNCPVCRGPISSLKEPAVMPRPPPPPPPVVPVAPIASRDSLAAAAHAPSPPVQRCDSLEVLLQSLAISAREQEEEDRALNEAMITIAQMESARAANDACMAGFMHASPSSQKCDICSEGIINRSVLIPCFHEFDLHCINSIVDSDDFVDKRCPTCDTAIHEIQFDINGPDSYSVKQVTEPLAVAGIEILDEACRQPRLDTELYAMACAKTTDATNSSGFCTICDQQMTDRSVVVPCFHEFDFHCIDSIIESGATCTCPTCESEILEIQFNINHMDSYSIKPVTGFRC